MQLVKTDDPILTTKIENFDFSNPPTDPYELAQDLVKFMYDNNGIGLAANQLGLPYRAFAMRGHPQNFVCFNPRVVQPSEQQVILEEGCLTYPGLLVKIKRPQHVRVRFTMANGETRTDTFTGMTARIFQHELDHLDGIKFFDRANRYHKEQALKKWKRGDVSTMRVTTNTGDYSEHLLRG
jgi:peptide deformylase